MTARLFAYLRPYLWPYFAGAIVCMVLYSVTSGVVPYLVRGFVDDFLVDLDPNLSVCGHFD